VQLGRLAAVAAVGVALASAVVFVSQSASSATLSPALRSHLQTERFQVVTSVRGLPLGVRERMQQLFGSATLDIADSGAEFQRNGEPDSTPLPRRRLVAAGCANDSHCLVYYERGGATITRRLMLFAWTPDETTFEWGAMAPDSFATVEEVRQAMAAGTIQGGKADTW
jgi:hypothetical protein